MNTQASVLNPIGNSALLAYVSAKPFKSDTPLLMKNAWTRAIPTTESKNLLLDVPISGSETIGSRGLLLHRILTNVYEQSMLYLPTEQLDLSSLADFGEFYDPALVNLGARIKRGLEHSVFSFLDENRRTATDITLDGLDSHLGTIVSRIAESPSQVVQRILKSHDSAEAMKFLLIQFAPDFLAEASQMARAMPGNFGPEHSALTKIFIDEYGYGKHEKKHSTLFQNCLSSVGMSPTPGSV